MRQIPYAVGWAGLLLLLELNGARCLAQTVRVGDSRILISANPTRLPADGQTVSRIRIEVRTRDNAPAPDGTPVTVNTDIGALTTDLGHKTTSATIPTEGGYALIYLISDEPGTATVQASMGNSRNRVLVEFVPLSEVGKRESTVVHVTGKWVGYCSDLELIEARGPAELRYRGLILEAETLQLNPRTLVVKADGVVLRRKDLELECEDTYLELMSMRGVCRRFGELGVEQVPYSAFTLKPSEAEQQIPEDAFRFDDREGRVWMVCKSVAIFPNEKIVLRSAALHVDQHRIMRYPPYWVIAFEGYQGSNNSQFLQFNSEGGLALDFPIFFSVTDSSTGALKIQRGASNASVMARQGWSFALEFTQSDPANEADSALVVHGLPRSDFGVNFQHTQKVLGGADASFSLAWPDHKSLFTDFSVFRYGSGGHLSFRSHLDRLDAGGTSYGANADFLSTAQPWGKRFNFRWGMGVEADRNAWNEDGFVFEYRTSAYLDLTPFQFGKATNLTPSFSNLFAWDTAHRHSNTARAQLALTHRVGKGINLNLRYILEHRSGESRYAVYDSQTGFTQELALNVSAFASQKWDAYLNASYDLTDSDIYGFGSLNYRPWEKYRLGLIGTYYEFAGTSFNDIEISFNRSLGGREIGVRYSTADDRVSLQFGAAQF
ncbi:MAG: hypothetical protein ACUVX8_02040 [Candidatus Zipacnadales bacterium]